MSSLINKAKAVLTGEPTTTNTTTGGVTGTHHNHHVGRDVAVGAGGVGIAEHEHRKHERERAAAHDSGLTTNNGIAANNGTAATAGTAGGLGPHSSSLLNKLDPSVDSTTGAVKTSSGATGTTAGGVTGTHHNHHVGRDAAVGVGGVGIAEHEHRKHERERAAGGMTTNSGIGATAGGLGPHSSSLLNKLDPSVDSTTGALKTSSGATGTTAGGVTGTHHNHHVGRDAAVGVGGVGIAEHEHRKHERERAAGGMTTNSGIGATAGTAGGLGPHSSSLLNKLDPRVDSTTGALKTSSGVTGTTAGTATGTAPGTHTHSAVGGNNYATGTAEGVNGPHSSRLANALDPRVDSDADGSTRIGATHATPGRGVAQNTAGPHNSDLVNKLDPRIDSDPNRSTNRTYV